jgi:NAD(P)H-quinone oxidoreductase subunit 5
MAMAPLALSLLVGVGIVTAVLGMLSMWAQTNVKRTLAWSTVSQMGFMMIQLGLGAFPVAVLHIVGHGCYKAWNFLACGWVVPAAHYQPMPPARHLALVTVGAAVAMTVIMTACRAFGIDLLHHPGEVTLAAVIALGIGQLWPIVLTTVSVSRMASAVGLTAVASFIALVMHRGATTFYEPLFKAPEILESPFGWALGGVVLVATMALVITHAMLPVLSRATVGRTLRTHALHGFYCGAVADRVVRLLPFSPVPAGAKPHA